MSPLACTPIGSSLATMCLSSAILSRRQREGEGYKKEAPLPRRLIQSLKSPYTGSMAFIGGHLGAKRKWLISNFHESGRWTPKPGQKSRDNLHQLPSSCGPPGSQLF